MDAIKTILMGCGALALASLLASESSSTEKPGNLHSLVAPKPSHFHGPAKSVIWCFLDGGASHIDLFDPKPELNKLHDLRGGRVSFLPASVRS